jgi:hypothetical protein
VKNFILIAAVTLLLLLPATSQAFFSPGLESCTLEELDAVLQKKRAEKKDVVKKLMAHGIVVRGGSAPSGLRAVTMDEWRFVTIRNPGTDVAFSGNSLTVNDWDSVSTWDMGTRRLLRVSVCTKDGYAIYGNSADGRTLVIGKEEKGEYRSELDLAVFDAVGQKKKTSLKYSDKLGIRRKNPRDQRVVDFGTSNDGKYFAMAETGGKYHVWDTETGKPVIGQHESEFLKGHFPAVAFSPDSKYVYITRTGNEGLVLRLPSCDVVMKYDPEQDLVRPLFSPAKTHMLFGKKLITFPEGREIHTFKAKYGDYGFTYDGNYVFEENNGHMVFFLLEDDGVERADVVEISKAKDDSPMWSHLAPDNRTVAHLIRTGGEGNRKIALSTQEVDIPTAGDREIFRKADQALKLYKAGLHKQGLAMMQPLIKQHSGKLFDKRYYNKICFAHMPMKVAGELLIQFGREASITPEQNEMRLRQFALIALWAGQPVPALQAVEQWEALSCEKTGKARTEILLFKADALKRMGKDDEYYNVLLSEAPGIKDFPELAAARLKVLGSILAPLLRDREKLAALTEIPVNDLPNVDGRFPKQEFPSLDGKLMYKGAPPKPERQQAAGEKQPAPAPEKKKSSVVLD